MDFLSLVKERLVTSACDRHMSSDLKVLLSCSDKNMDQSRQELLEKLKKIAKDTIDNNESKLFELNQKIWQNPELAFEENKAHDFLTDFLGQAGFEVTRGPYGSLETAFRAVSGKSKKISVGIICEYDALPGIGHACGHNLISEVGVGAALGLKAALESTDIELGRVVVLGTPGEESNGGKIVMIENDCFNDIDFCMMSHPKPFNCIYPSTLVCKQVKVTFKGFASHAAAYPWDGLNALDAAVVAYNNISVLRQQMRPRWRVHGVITNGGLKPNVIPDETSMWFYVRTPTEEEMTVLSEKVQDCFEAASKATGCSVNIEWVKRHYSNVTTNEIMAQLYQTNAESLGLEFMPRNDQEKIPVGSTDMGNLSHVKPSIHPFFDIDTDEPNHTGPFAAASARPEAHKMALLQSKTLAMIALDVMCNEELMKDIQNDFIRAHPTKK